MKDIVTHHDFHARVLDRFGREHSKLVYGRSGRELSLTDKKPAHVVRDILV